MNSRKVTKDLSQISIKLAKSNWNLLHWPWETIWVFFTSLETHFVFIWRMMSSLKLLLRIFPPWAMLDGICVPFSQFYCFIIVKFCFQNANHYRSLLWSLVLLTNVWSTIIHQNEIKLVTLQEGTDLFGNSLEQSAFCHQHLKKQNLRRNSSQSITRLGLPKCRDIFSNLSIKNFSWWLCSVS